MTQLRRGLLTVVGLLALALPGSEAAGGDRGAPDLAPYTRLGTWIDVYSPSFHADPDQLADALAGRGVHTLFVETGNFRQRADLVAPQQLGRLVEAAHARGIAVVAWYLPGFTDPTRDLRRARAAIRFRTGAGERFDSFALDIEASTVRNSDERTHRLLDLSKRLRADVGLGYPLGSIIPSPVGMKLLPRYWPRFPYAALVRIYDVVLPMAYYSYRARGPAAVSRYVRTSILIIRQASGDPTVPLHVIGGLASATSARDVAAFADAVAGCGVRGLSLYDYDSTARTMWSSLGDAATETPTAKRC